MLRRGLSPPPAAPRAYFSAFRVCPRGTRQPQPYGIRIQPKLGGPWRSLLFLRSLLGVTSRLKSFLRSANKYLFILYTPALPSLSSPLRYNVCVSLFLPPFRLFLPYSPLFSPPLSPSAASPRATFRASPRAASLSSPTLLPGQYLMTQAVCCRRKNPAGLLCPTPSPLYPSLPPDPTTPSLPPDPTPYPSPSGVISSARSRSRTSLSITRNFSFRHHRKTQSSPRPSQPINHPG